MQIALEPPYLIVKPGVSEEEFYRLADEESDPGLDYREKLPRYRDAGIPEIWIVDRFRQVVLRDTLVAEGRQSETLSSGRLSSSIMPGFWIEVSWLWQEKLPSTLDCLRKM